MRVFPGHEVPVFAAVTPVDGIAIRVSDPEMRVAVERVVAQTPPQLFNKKIGVTLITTDIPRAQNPLEEHDFAYWTGNEIRLMQTLDVDKVEHVLRHELGHSLNVHLIEKFGSTKAVRAWHDRLWKVSKREGFVSKYAKNAPIENAAEATRLYLYEKRNLMLNWPLTFAFLRRAYRDIL